MPQPMICFPVSGGTPDNTLPGGTPGGGGRPDNTLPSLPGYPDNGLPSGGSINLPGNPIVIPPNIDNTLPPVIWPGVPIHPGKPDNPIVPPPGTVWPPLPPAAGTSGKAWVMVAIPGVGVRWVVVDLGSRPTQPIAPTPSPKG